jgi:1-acyl-sn-glycerol-3-phosphate acyltransferase
MNPSYFLGWLFFRITYTVYFRARYHNPERVPPRGPVILAANHESFLDPPLVGTGPSRAICYLARDSLFRFPALGWLLRSWKTIPIDREGGGPAGLRMVLDRLQAGEAVVLFPEGTRTPSGQAQRARSGIGLTIVKSEAPVVPVRVFGTFRAYGRHVRIPRPYPVAVKYGEPIQFDQAIAEARTCTKARMKEIYQEIASQVMQAIARLEPHTDKDRFP